MRATWPVCERANRAGPPIGGLRPEEDRLFGVLMSREPSGDRLPEDRLCRMLAEAGAGLGVRVIAFSPAGVREGGGRASVRGWTLEGGVWTPAEAPAPPVYFDRRFPRDPAELRAGVRAVRILHAHGAVPLGRALPGKARVLAALGRNPLLASLLPPTARLNVRRLAGMLRTHPAGLFLKPAAGMQGRGALSLRPEPGGAIRIAGRSMRNRPYALRVPEERLARAAAAIVRGRSYLVQPLLNLRTPADEPFDLRVFAQKDGAGRWVVSCTAVRIGRPGAAASNLHGGGKARAPLPYLAEMLGDRAAAVLARAKRAALLAAREAERAFGRQAEIGADFGIEPDGRLWLLELNGKPGRAIFAAIGDAEGERLAAKRTVAYALRLMAAGRPAAGRFAAGSAAAYGPTACGAAADTPASGRPAAGGTTGRTEARRRPAPRGPAAEAPHARNDRPLYG
ncbi:MAG: hypothetical protein A9Z00_07360 [Thermobacillus sp. ZCTH02-B1]|uniref:YheC/YheD family protein n=1 Tax=Thermobacillus sp. ZCTH02-B1 TaxID=1858795 RepID=UPI000B55F6D0|nr:YheC/YheD family protein [Thermobacillus sp. ZCTH02-B1]OUM96145.1 MAG: hypothetical protein A9Z00_07360 [Thermobacillus sp. ZCTH02-B1]